MANKKGIVTILVLIALAAIAWGILNMKEQRTTGEKIGDAIDALDKGANDAVKELEDRTLGEKLKDAVTDDSAKDSKEDSGGAKEDSETKGE